MKVYFPGLAEKCRELFVLIMDSISETAKEHGYAVAWHGSMARDIDLVAVPWIENCSSQRDVAEAIRKAAEKTNPMKVAFISPSEEEKSPKQKPHGRLCWSYHLGAGVYIDLSVLPPTTKT